MPSLENNLLELRDLIKESLDMRTMSANSFLPDLEALRAVQWAGTDSMRFKTILEQLIQKINQRESQTDLKTSLERVLRELEVCIQKVIDDNTLLHKRNEEIGISLTHLECKLDGFTKAFGIQLRSQESQIQKQDSRLQIQGTRIQKQEIQLRSQHTQIQKQEVTIQELVTESHETEFYTRFGDYAAEALKLLRNETKLNDSRWYQLEDAILKELEGGYGPDPKNVFQAKKILHRICQAKDITYNQFGIVLQFQKSRNTRFHNGLKRMSKREKQKKVSHNMAEIEVLPGAQVDKALAMKAFIRYYANCYRLVEMT